MGIAFGAQGERRRIGPAQQSRVFQDQIENRGFILQALADQPQDFRSALFAGKAVEWLPELTAEDRDAQHPFVRNYGSRFDAVRDHVVACNFCTIRFGVKDQVEASGVPIEGEGKAHATMGRLIDEGWEIVTF